MWDLDIPSEYTMTSAYSATLGHKVKLLSSKMWDLDIPSEYTMTSDYSATLGHKVKLLLCKRKGLGYPVRVHHDL